MADPKDSASKAAIPLELLKVEAAFLKRAVTSSSGKRSKGQGAPSYKRDVMYAASKHHLKDTSIHSETAFAGLHATPRVSWRRVEAGFSQAPISFLDIHMVGYVRCKIRRANCKCCSEGAPWRVEHAADTGSCSDDG